MKFLAKLIAVLALTVSALGAHAQLVNGSFETGPAVPNPPGYLTLPGGNTSITGWTVMAPDIDYIEAYWTAANGTRSLDLSGTGGSTGGISQTFTTVAGHNYSVTFSMAGNFAGPPTIKTMTVQATGGAPQTYTFDTTGRSAASMGWTTETYLFTATGASTTLSFQSGNNTGYGPALDNVVVTDLTAAAAGIPTLSQWALALLAGLLGLVAVGRFHQGSRRSGRRTS